MSGNNINLTAPIHAATAQGKAVAAREVFMDGDKETVQQIGDKTHQLEEAIKDITATGGASTANAVSYSNETSGMTAVTAQGAIDELVTKNKSQDATIAAKAEKSDVQAAVSELKEKDSTLSVELAKKANVSDVTSKITEESNRVNSELAKKANAEDVSSLMQTEQERVNTEFAKKFDKEYVLQELGSSERKVLSQKAATSAIKENTSKLKELSSILSSNAVFKGVANPNTNPGTPTSPTFFLAYSHGTYVNFGGVTITCLSVIRWVKNTWEVFPLLNRISDIGIKGTHSVPCNLSEVISSIPESERVAGKLVLFKNSDYHNRHALAIFNSDSYASDWANENNWVVINFSDLNNTVNKPITEEKIANGAITEEKISKGAVTETKIAKEAIDSLKSYNNTKTNLDAATLQDAIDKILTLHYAGGIVNINARYADSPTKTYTLEEAIACVPEYEQKTIKGLLYNKTGTKKPTLAFYLKNSVSNFTDTSFWIEIDLHTSKSVFNAYQSVTFGSTLNDMSLAEAIELVPEGERHPGKIVVFKNSNSWSLAIFNSDAFKSGWTNENNWVVVDTPDLKLVSSIKQIIDDISALKSSVNDKSNEINQLKEGLTGKVDKISGKVLSTNDYTNEDKEKLNALSIPTIPDSVIKNAVDTYVEENNADLSLKDKTLNVITNYTYKLKENVLGTPVSIGTNWGGDMESGFTHAAGSEEALEFDISAIPLNSKVLVRFDATNLKGGVDILVSVGDLPKIKSYNGSTSFKAGVIYTGGTLKFIPTELYAGTISNIKCQVISNDGTELYEDRQDVIYNTRKDFVYGFWNFFVGGEKTALKAQDITRSIAIGNYALGKMVVGNRNIAIGTFALPEVVEGEDNVAIGADTIYPLVKANKCVGIGKGTLGGSKSADCCVAVGGGAMGIYTSDYDRKNCVAVGVNAGIPIAENCTHVGYRAGANVVGKNNTSIGYNSMCYGTAQGHGVTGENLVCVGYKAEVANTPEAKSATNSMALGANTTITKSNQVVLGNAAVEEVLIAGKKIIFYEDGTVKWENVT